MKKICYFDDGISFYFGGVMQSVERRMRIFEILKEKKVIQVVDLASVFHVSNMTIRRDLAKLEEQGVLFEELREEVKQKTGKDLSIFDLICHLPPPVSLRIYLALSPL